MIAFRPTTRRVIYVFFYELIAIVLSTVLLMLMSKSDAQESAPVAIAISIVAVIWNYTFNFLFEAWERRTYRTSRSIVARVVHASVFEVGLCLFTIPLYMFWYGVSLWQALVMEMAILLFFLLYTFVFTWIFDTVVALPQHARQG